MIHMNGDLHLISPCILSTQLQKIPIQKSKNKVSMFLFTYFYMKIAWSMQYLLYKKMVTTLPFVIIDQTYFIPGKFHGNLFTMLMDYSIKLELANNIMSGSQSVVFNVNEYIQLTGNIFLLKVRNLFNYHLLHNFI